MMRGDATLENGLEFERPRFIDELPVRIVRDRGLRRLKIGREVRAKIQPAFAGGSIRQGVKKIRLQYPVLMVPNLRPRIGKQNKRAADPRMCRQRFQEQACLSLEESEVRESCSIALAERPFDTLTHHVDSHALLLGMRGGIGRQEMPVSRADFPDKFAQLRGQSFELSLQPASAVGQQRAVKKSAGKVFHKGSIVSCAASRSPARLQPNQEDVDVCGVHTADPTGLANRHGLSRSKLLSAFFT